MGLTCSEEAGLFITETAEAHEEIYEELLIEYHTNNSFKKYFFCMIILSASLSTIGVINDTCIYNTGNRLRNKEVMA